MNSLDFIALLFAAGAVVDVWRNGSIFAKWRTYVRLRVIAESDAQYQKLADTTCQILPWFWCRTPLIFIRLLDCTFCLLHHTPWALAVLFYLPALWVSAEIAWLFKLPVYSLAITRLNVLINSQTPIEIRYDVDPYEEPYNSVGVESHETEETDD